MSDAKKNVALMCSSLSGHAQLFVRLGEWLLLQPGIAVHLIAHEKVKGSVPAGMLFHACNEEIVDLEPLFQGVADNSTGWHDSIGRLMSGMTMDNIGYKFEQYLNVIDDIQPDLLVAEPAFNATNHLQAFCKSRAISLALLVCPSRPDPLVRISTLIPLLLGHFRAISSAIQVLAKAKEQITKAVKITPASDSDQPWTLFPGSRALMKGSLGKHQVFTGPFLRLPDLAHGNQGSVLPQGDLWNWFKQDPEKPVIYIAFGTLVRPSKELVERLVEALDAENLRVLWSLPKDVHSSLPSGLTLKQGWRIETFVPQDKILRLEQVKCFLSHCGANSVNESLSLGVPMVCMPFYCDQYEWAASVCQECKAGIQVDKRHSSAADIRKAVKEVVANPIYSRQAKAAAQRMRAHVRACAKELGTQVADSDHAGTLIAGEIVMRCLRGDSWQDFVPALKAATDQYAPSSDVCCFHCV